MNVRSRILDQSARWSGSPVVRSLVNFGFRMGGRMRVAELAASSPVDAQRVQLGRLVKRAARTRFGRDHGFAEITTPAQFQAQVPIRTYEQLWNDYLRDHYPVLDDLLWPGRVPYFALTSGTTLGPTKYIPVSREMTASNRKAARTMLAYYMAQRPDSRLFHGKVFFLGGSTRLETPARGVQAGDLSGIAAIEIEPLLRPYTYPPLELALESDWDQKLARLADQSRNEPITLVGGVPSWLLMLFERVLAITGKSTIAQVWPNLELVVHGGVRFDPYRDAFQAILGSPSIQFQETYPCSEGFVGFGDPRTGLLRLLLDHGIFLEFIPRAELGRDRPDRRWLGTIETGVDYAIVVSTCAGLWAHVIGDVVRFERLDPPLFRFMGRVKDAISAFGEHLISDEVEKALASACRATGATVRDWHAGPVFEPRPGHHLYVVEFFQPPADAQAFRDHLDDQLANANADYRAHRARGVGLPAPAVVIARSGGFENWMRSRGKLGGQHKTPRMDGTGSLTAEIVAFLRSSMAVESEISPVNRPPGSP